MDSSDQEFLETTSLYRPGRHKSLAGSAHSWARPVRELLQHGYSFLPERYSNGGYLFRGMRSGARQAIVEQVFGHATGVEEMDCVERAMEVYFLTHEISDAISASALYNTNNNDNAILVIRSDYFNRQLQAYCAAVLAIGDAGVVFRYPFVTMPISMENVDFIITTTATINIPEKLQDKHIDLAGDSRRQLEHTLQVKFGQLNVSAATPVASNQYPVNHC